MSELTTELEQVVEQLLRESTDSGHISLDEIGDAIGARPVSYVDVDAVINALEEAGRRVEAGAKPRGEEHLQLIIRSIRELSLQLGRRPTQQEISARTGLRQTEVSHALQLARIMQR